MLVIFNAIIFISLNKPSIRSKNNFDDVKNSVRYVKISIIVSIRNEEKNINELISGLENLDYPDQNFEVIIIDDNSYDNTFIVLKNNISEKENFFVYKNDSEGKRGAITYGIKKSRFPFIMITDGDCKPETGWLKHSAALFDSGYDMIFGISPFYRDNSFVNKISCFENLRNSFLTFTFASLGIPYSAAARNFGFNKEKFYSIGGYANTKDTLSGDDDLLLREAVKNKLKVGILTNRNSFVFSCTKKTFREYFQQRARHTQTSFHYLLKHKILLGSWHTFNLLLLFSPLLMTVNPFFGILFVLKMLADITTTKILQKKFGYRFYFYEAIYLQVIYEIFLIVHFFNAKFSKIKWK